MTTPNDTEPPKELTQPTQEETSQLNINVSPCLTAKEYRKNLCRLLDDHLVGVENLLKEKVPLGDRREQALRPYQTASDQLKAEIDNLPLYAIIPDSLHSCLVNAKLLQTEKLERALNYLEKLHEAFGEFKALTATDTSLDAQKEIIKSLETIERFCERYNISQGDWHQKLEEVISENARLKAENDDLKVNFHLQDIQMDEEEENDLLLTDAEKRESTRFGFLDHVEYGGETDLFQSIAPPPRVPTNRLSSQHPQASITTARNPSEIANNFGPGSYTHSQPPLNTSEWYFKSQALPPLEKFRGLSERSLDEFLESFDSKYPPMLFNDSERRNAFVRLLKDNAERAYKSLDDVSQRGSLASIVAKMRRFLARGNQVTSLDATRQIEHLKLIPEQLTQFCDRLEQLTRQAYPSMPHDDLSFMRAEQLYRRITHWNNSIEALRILESTPRTTVYACLKKFVFQLERSRQHHMNLNNTNRLGKSQRRPQPQMSTMPNSNDENHRPRNIVEPLPVVASCYECGQDGHYRRNCPRIRNMSNPPNGRNQGRPQAQPQPSNMRNQQSFSNNRGNQQSNPMNQNHRQNNFSSNNQGRNDRAPTIHSIDGRQDDAKPPTTTFTSNEKPLFALDHSSDRVNVNSLINVASTVNSLVVNDLVYFGEKPMYEVKIGDLRGPALLDSGAQPSTMTLCTYRQIIETLPDPEKYLKLLDPPPGKTQPIYNASGVEMAIKGIVLMQVRLLATQKESSVVFHIITDKPTDGPRELILGTNAFQALGVKLAFDATTPTFPQVTTSMENPVQSTIAEAHEIVVAKRIEIFPSEVRWIPLEMKNFESFSGGEAIISSPAKVSGREFFDQVVCRFDEKGSCRILLTNKSPQLMVLARGQMIGQATTARNVYSISALQIPEVIECLKVEGESTERHVVDKESRLVDIVKENHTETIPPEIIDILKDFKDYFAIEENDLRQTQLVLHDIDTKEAKPIRQKVRPVPAGVRKQFKEIINSLLERKVIEHSSSPWASPIVLVEKKDGSLRLCIDYRQLNKAITLDAYPLPSIEGILQSLNGKKFFSTLDLFAGFWQIGLKDSAKPKTAFITTEGLYQFRVVPFGLATSPATFQRLMNTVLGKFMSDTREVHIYIDDVLIATETKERHFVVLREVMSAFANANLAVKISKCQFLQQSVPYLGHVIDGKGIHTDPKKVEAIRQAHPPKNVKELRSFLGLCGYYRRFILRFAAIAKPLFELTRDNQIYKWTPDCNEAFLKLKETLSTAPVLSQPDIEGGLDGSNPFVIFTDASGTGIGAVLSQRGPDSLLHPLWFMSKSLTKAETRYHATDLEALAVVAALKKFQSLLYNMKGTVVKTDHQGLLGMFKKQVSARMLRWSLLIQHFNVTIEYVKGKANTVADALSRGITPPLPESDDETKICEELGNVVVASVQCNESWLTELREEETYRLLIEVLLENASSESQAETNRRRPTKATPNILLKEGNHKLTISDFCIEEGFLWLCIDGEQPRRVVPLSQRLALFEEVHAGTYAGHFSPLKIYRLLKKNYFWANMSKDIHTWHRRCAKCFLTNVNDKLTPPLHPISTSRPYELVGVDLMELGLTTTGNKYVLVLIDHFSKWLGAYPIPGKSADIVARTISTRWLGEGRWPEKFISDQGPEFLNEILDILRKLTKIQWTVTKGYNPRENGVTERVNKTLQRCLRKLVDHPGEWDNFLPFVTSAYNYTSHSTTGESPFFILHGFDPKFPIGSNIPERTAYQEIDYSQYKECLVDIIREAHNIVKERTSQEMERCKEFYDRKNKVDSKRYPIVGDRVFVRLPPSRTGEKFPKLVFDVKGPYRVIETSANSALLTLIYGNEEPIRIQFDLILVVPPGLEIPEHNPKRRRKAVPKHLGFTGTLTDKGTIVAQINTSFSRPNTDMKNILPSDAGHPHFLCSGTIDNNRRVILCNISTCTMKDLADIVTYTIPESCYEKPVTTVGAIAQVLAVLEAHSIHPKLKEQMILEGTTCPISTDTWIRGFHIGMLQCHHIRQFFEEHQGEAVAITKNAFLPPSGITDREMTLVAKNIFDPPVKPPKTDDLMLFPEQRLYEKISELVLTQGVVTPYQDHTDIVGTLFKQPKLRQVLIFLKTQETPEELDILLRQTQKAAEVTDTRILIAMPPVTKTTEHWIEFYFNWKKIYQNFIEELAEQNAIPRIYKLDVEEVGPLHHSTPWSLLGYQLNNLTPQGQLSVKQLDAFLDAIKKTAKDQDVKLRIHVHRKQTRQMPATRQAAPPSHQQNRRRHLGPNPNEPANRRFPAMQQQDNLHHGHNHQMYQQRRPPTPADPYRRHAQHHNQSRRSKSTAFDYLHELFNKNLKSTLANHYLRDTIPKIAKLALRLPELITQPIPRLLTGSAGSVTLSQEQAACLLANAFFCTFPAPAFNLGWRKTYFNFERLYIKGRRCKMEKIKCLLHYFDSVLTKMPEGVLSIRRHRADDVDFLSTNEPLCELVVHDDGRIEDNEDRMVEIDFANKYIGGGVLNAGCVQEEIKFVLCPELLVSMLICERMDDKEAISIIGTQRFSDYSGYGDSFNYVERVSSTEGARDQFHRLLSETVAINATKFNVSSVQFESGHILRELTKAFAGFDHLDKLNRPLATGNWGCGVYKGDRQLKSLIQLIAASVLKRSAVHYYTFGDGDFARQLGDIYRKLLEKGIRTGSLLTHLLKYNDHKSKLDCFQYIDRCIS